MTFARANDQQAHRLKPVGFLVGLLLLGWAAPTFGHPISVVIETAYVDRDKVTVEVEVYAEDLFFYHGLMADDRSEVSAEALREAATKHGPLLLERLPVFDAAGRRVEGGKVVSVSGADEFPPAVPVGELMGYSLVYRLELPLASPPEFLSFSQRLVGPGDGFPALVDFRVKQAGREEEVEATLKPGNVRTVRCDWPGGAAAAADAEREEWMKEARADAFGATALNSVRSFLYVGRREVRHELMIPFPLLESYFTVDREHPDFLSPAEQEAAKAKVGQFFRGKNPVSIDGPAREPGTVRVEFFTLEDRDLTKTPERRAVSAVNARVGVILAYPTGRPAAEVKLVWDAFNRQAWRVDAFCFAGDEVLRPRFSMATRQDTFVWKRPEAPEPLKVGVAAAPPPPVLAVPWLSALTGAAGLVLGLAMRHRPRMAGGVVATALLVGASSWSGPRVVIGHPFTGRPVVSDRVAEETFQRLHGNLYLAAEAATEEEALDALATAADGELLRELYLRLARTFREADESGAVPVTSGVKILSGSKAGEPTERGGFDYECRWEVAGRVEHWGHVHSRRYRYDALFRVEPRSGRWTITAMDLRDARLIEDRSTGLL